MQRKPKASHPRSQTNKDDVHIAMLPHKNGQYLVAAIHILPYIFRFLGVLGGIILIWHQPDIEVWKPTAIGSVGFAGDVVSLMEKIFKKISDP